MIVHFVKVRSSTRLLRIDVRDRHRTIGTLRRDGDGWVARMCDGRVVCGLRRKDVRARLMQNHQWRSDRLRETRSFTF